MNFVKMMELAQKMQSRMESLQSDLDSIEVEGIAGAGLVKAVMTCRHRLSSLWIDPSIIDRDDRVLMEDLIVAAINDAAAKVEVKAREKTAEVTGDLQLPPGLKLPF